MFERFAEPATQVLALAREEAGALGHDLVGTEHILLGLARVQDGAAARALAGAGVTVAAVRLASRRADGGQTDVAAAPGAFTAAAKHSLELALKAALDRSRDLIDTEHLLLGLLAEAEGTAVRAIVAVGSDPRAVEAGLIRIIGGDDGDAEVAAGAELDTASSFAAWLGAALTSAAAEATADGRTIEVTDFLLALAGDPQSPAGWVFAELGIDEPTLRATAEHLRLLEREIARVGREMHEAAASHQPDRAGALRDQRRQLIAQRQRRGPAARPGDGEESADG